MSQRRAKMKHAKEQQLAELMDRFQYVDTWHYGKPSDDKEGWFTACGIGNAPDCWRKPIPLRDGVTGSKNLVTCNACKEYIRSLPLDTAHSL